MELIVKRIKVDQFPNEKWSIEDGSQMKGYMTESLSIFRRKTLAIQYKR